MAQRKPMLEADSFSSKNSIARTERIAHLSKILLYKLIIINQEYVLRIIVLSYICFVAFVLPFSPSFPEPAPMLKPVSIKQFYYLNTIISFSIFKIRYRHYRNFITLSHLLFYRQQYHHPLASFHNTTKRIQISYHLMITDDRYPLPIPQHCLPYYRVRNRCLIITTDCIICHIVKLPATPI